MTSALPSISPSIAVKYRVSGPPGAAFGCNFIWARAGAEAAARPSSRSGSTRIAEILDGQNRCPPYLANLCVIGQKEGRPEAADLRSPSCPRVRFLVILQ